MLGFCWCGSRLTALGLPCGGAYRFWSYAVGFPGLDGGWGSVFTGQALGYYLYEDPVPYKRNSML